VSTDGLPGPGDDLPKRAADVVRAVCTLVPRVGLVLGSGLGPALGDAFEQDASFSFSDLPGFPPPGVPGHEGRLGLGRIANVPVAVYAGRVHFYEGHGMDVPALLPRLARELGAETMILTAAAGGVKRGLAAGTVVVIADHVNLMGTAPLRGWRFPDGMPAFIPMAGAYDADLVRLTLERAGALGIAAASGIYAAMSGPAYETPAEVSLAARAGASVVGMSVVPEVLPARALRMRVLGLSMVTNALGEPVSHEDVVRVSNETAKAVGRLLVDLLPRIEEKETADGM